MRKHLLFSLLLLWTVFYDGSIFGKTTGEHKDQIEWEFYSKNNRSLLPITGYIEDGFVTICLYESPATAWVSITDKSGNTVYECSYTDMSQETIDLSTLESGAYEIVVEYNGKGFVGHFVL